jgi:hypothetical protein
MAFTALDITKTWEDGEYWTEAIMDGVVTELEAWGGTGGVVLNNIEQMRLDIFPSTYTIDNDGAANLTNKIYDKQTESNTWSAVVDLETAADTGWEGVSDIVVTFTPELPGDYRATFVFTHAFYSTAGTAMTLACQFRLSDGSTTGGNIRSGTVSVGGGAVLESFIVPITISHVFTLTAGVATTIQLQKYLTAATNVGVHRIDAAADNYFTSMYVEKI